MAAGLLNSLTNVEINEHYNPIKFYIWSMLSLQRTLK